MKTPPHAKAILQGIGSIIDIFPTIPRKRTHLQARPESNQFLQDFESVGRDLQSAGEIFHHKITPLSQEISRLLEMPGLEPEARMLLEMAKEAAITGTMPDLGKVQKAVNNPQE